MPTGRALTSFRPEKLPPFDVLVVDEASQIGLEAVPLLALAKRTIVVGDDKQTSPENVGLGRQQVFNLLDEHLAMIPKYRTLFDPDGSLYDLAFQKFPGVVMLTEHFRCLPPIIAFSNAHAYNNRIIPLRDQPPRPGWAALGAVKVQDGYRNGMVNVPEAEAVVGLVAELCANPDYDGMTMGVISLLGSSQSKLIWDKLYDRVGPEVMTQRELRSGEPANFQGDERDVIIISTVVAVDPGIPSARVSAMTNNAAMRRINVAASRARQQMWVVHSLDPDRFIDGDMRGALIRHCRDAGTMTAPPANLLEACESQFERDVLRKITAREYRKVSVQYRVGRYRIDIVIEGPHSRLAVECDGDRWHGPDVWHKDRARQEVLERANWTFERIRGSAFYRDPDAAMLPLWQRLTDLSIPTGDWWSTEAPQPVVREVSGAGQHPDPVESTEDTRAENQSYLAAIDPVADKTSAMGTTRAKAPVLPPSSHSPVSFAAKTAAADDEMGVRPPLATPVVAPAETPRAWHPAVRSQAKPALPAYQTWQPRPLPHPDTASPSQLVAGLVDIVTAQGPMHAQHAYRVYTQAAGGHRVGTEIRRALDAATRKALRTGALGQLDDDLLLSNEKTLYAPSQPPVLLRELGTRQLSDVPRSEVAELIKLLALEDGSADEIKRAVLNAYGLIRLTQKTNLYLDECLRYHWRAGSFPLRDS
jgi:very-short-patch-repair endonuclease